MVRIKLTPKQLKQLEPIKELVQEAYLSGNPGMALAQVFFNYGNETILNVAVVGFIEGDIGIKIIRTLENNKENI